MDDLFGTMMDSTGGELDDQAAGDDPLADVLGGLLAGSGGTGGGAGMGQLVQAMLGGGLQGASAQGAGGMEGLLGSLLGGGGSGMAANPLVAPIADALADKLGLSREVAQVVVGFALSKLLSAILGGSRQPDGRSTAQDSMVARQLVDQVRSGGDIDPNYLASTGLTQELVDRTGLDAETAERSLQETFAMLGSQMTASTGERPQQGPDINQGLDSLLD
jgi:hypothetical protein